jgi:pilus assembly protein CpaB
MNTRMVLLAVFAVVAAAVTFFLAKTWIDSQRDQMRRQQESMKASKSETVQVLVAKQNLPTGLILARDHVEWKQWPEKGVASTYFVEGREKLDDVVGSVVRGGIIAGEPIAKGRVIAPGDRGFMAAVLHPGMRAISIRVRPDTSVSGFVKPGDDVDLVLVHSAVPETADPPKPHKLAETILSDIRVIAIDQKPDDQNGSASVAKTVTFEVTRKQAEIVSVAEQLGTLSIVLRSLARADVQPDQIAKATERPTRTWDSEASRVLPSIGSPTNRLQVIRGNDSTNVALPTSGAGGISTSALAHGALEAASGGVQGGVTAARVITP